MSGLYLPLFRGRLRLNVCAPAVLWIMLVSEGAAFMAALLFAALIHEAGHLFFIKLFRQRVIQVDIEPFGAVIYSTTDGLTYSGEVAIAFGGIAFNCLAGCIGGAVFAFLPCVEVLVFVLSCLAFAVTNLIPLKSNDGGRLVSIYAESRGDLSGRLPKAAAFAGALVIIAAGIAVLYLSGFNNGLCVLLLLAALPK